MLPGLPVGPAAGASAALAVPAVRLWHGGTISFNGRLLVPAIQFIYNWRMIELKHLRVLKEISELGTISAAARALGYSQPAVTQQLQAVERLVGTPLLVRGRGGMLLTEAGQVLLRHGTSVLAAMSLAEAEVAAVTGLRAGKVRIASFPSGTASVVPGALSHMVDAHPGVSFSLVEAEPEQALAMLGRGECDIALVFSYSTEPDRPPAAASANTVSYPLLEEAVHVVLADDHPAAAEEKVSLCDLRDSRWIAGCPQCRGHLMYACAAAGFSPDIAYETDDYVALQSLAAKGLGVALVPDLILSVVRLPMLRLRPVDPPAVRRVSAVCTPDLARVPGVRATLAALGEAAADVSRAAERRADELRLTVSAARTGRRRGTSPGRR